MLIKLFLHDSYGSLRSPFEEMAGIKQVLLRVETISTIQIAQLALTFPNDSNRQLPPILYKQTFWLNRDKPRMQVWIDS